MGLLDTVIGGGVGFLTGGWPGAIAGAIGSYNTSNASEAAAKQAQGMSAEQRALLAQLKAWGDKYGDPMLAKYWDYAINPYQNTFERNQTERTRQDIERAYRPAYATGMNNLSSRGQFSPFSSLSGRLTSSMDRARAGAVGDMYLQQGAARQGEMGNRLAQFSNMLTQLRGGNVSGAGAYSQPISTYAGLAQQGMSGLGGGLAGLLQLYQLMQMKKKPGAGTSPYIDDTPGAENY